jgi:hypothetical protein
MPWNRRSARALCKRFSRGRPRSISRTHGPGRIRWDRAVEMTSQGAACRSIRSVLSCSSFSAARLRGRKGVTGGGRAAPGPTPSPGRGGEP